MHRFREVFFEEAAERVAELESGLLQLEASPDCQELLHTVFRAAHSIKGGSATFGLERVARFTHSLENLLGRLREGRMPVTRTLVDLLLRATDVLRSLLAAERDGTPVPERLEAISAELKQALGESALLDSKPRPASPPPEAARRIYRVHFAPHEDVFRRGLDPLLLLRDLASLGQVVHSEVDLGRLPPLGQMDPESCYLAWTVVLESARPEEELADVFTFVRDDSEIHIEPLPDAGTCGSVAAPALPASAAESAWTLKNALWLLPLAERLVESYERLEQAVACSGAAAG